MKILTVLGARPQFVKAATVSRVIRGADRLTETIVHTGQHYDDNMSSVFFEQLDIPKPDYYLGISGGGHGDMTGRMLAGIETVILADMPDLVLVYGDTNSTLAGSLAANKLGVAVAHIEAGLRSHKPAMPEEINRCLTDRFSCLLFCPVKAAEENLRAEGFPFHSMWPGGYSQRQRIIQSGDVMFDACLHYRDKIKAIDPREFVSAISPDYIVCTVHRQENTEDPNKIMELLEALKEASSSFAQIIWPMHPRTRKKIEEFGGGWLLSPIIVVDPLPFFEMHSLMLGAKAVITDSGGVQKEAFFYRVPCITVRDETEWGETLEGGWNRLSPLSCVAAVGRALEFGASASRNDQSSVFGDGKAAELIVSQLR